MPTQTSATPPPAPPKDARDVRQRILECASELFYRQGVRAVGVDLVVARSGVAKTSLYRHFRNKDELIAAFLQREDEEFWAHWDAVAARHAGAPLEELLAHMQWIGERVRRPNYRGCPQINVSAEFPDQDHPSRHVARAHMRALRERLAGIANKLGVARPDDLATQLAVLVNGAFVSMELLEGGPADRLLAASAKALVDAA